MPICEFCAIAISGYAPKYPFDHKDIQHGGGNIFLGLQGPADLEPWSERDAFDSDGLRVHESDAYRDIYHSPLRRRFARVLRPAAKVKARLPRLTLHPRPKAAPDGLPTLLSEEEAFSLKHHESLQQLEDSAQTCNVCALIHASASIAVEGWVRHNLREQEAFIAWGVSPDQPGFDSLGNPEEYRLNTVRCRNGRDGFLVYVNPTGGHYLVVAAIGLSIPYGDPMAAFFRGRPIEEDASSKKVLDHAAAWITNCTKRHSCGTSKRMKLPLRVLDISAKRSGKIHLRQTEGKAGRYAALSHCWGDKGHFVTNKGNITERLAGIDFEALPLSFREAILVAEHIGLSYLWIDSLCICQDDVQEWARESAKMGKVYADALVVLSADSAPDATHSILHRKRIEYAVIAEEVPGEVYAFSLPVESEINHRDYVQLGDEPLSGRAWGLQERHLARRILHFASDQMHFECNEEFLSEDGFRAQGRLSRVDDTETSYERFNITSQHSKLLSAWYHTLAEYTSRQLTYPSDMLPGISGLAKVWEKRLKAKYVAGLWSTALIEGLLWSPAGRTNRDIATETRRQWAGPSWSWVAQRGASITGTPVEVLGPRVFRDNATVLDWHVDLKTSDPHGEIKSAWIKIRTPIERLEFVEPWSTQPAPNGRKRNFQVRSPKDEDWDPGLECYLDHNQRVWPPDEEIEDWIKQKEFYALLLMEETQQMISKAHFMTLIVSPADVQDDKSGLRKMERWGCGRLFFDPDLCTTTETVILV